ncbi:MAG: hypothetical protein KUG73_05100 [Pseudomonadales bacterium]|nr:hypothetical protein [Pseudomonadales bacterium]
MTIQLPDMIFAKNKVNILVIRSDGDVEIELKTPSGEPVLGAVYVVTKTDGEKITGKLDDSGYAKIVSENLMGATIVFECGRALTEAEFNTTQADLAV